MFTAAKLNAKLNDENEQIADFLVGLTRAKEGLGLRAYAFLFLPV